jgi:hypothetical protein
VGYLRARRSIKLGSGWLAAGIAPPALVQGNGNPYVLGAVWTTKFSIGAWLPICLTCSPAVSRNAIAGMTCAM